MARSTANQPMTRDVKDLVIGLMKVSMESAVDATAPTTASTDLGAIQSAAIVMEMTYKEHVSGYPEEEDFKILETKNVGFKISPEEVGSTAVRGLITQALTSLKTGQLAVYAVEGVIQKSSGDRISLFSNHCELKPEINISTDNDWGAIEFNYEWAYNSSYTNNKPLYKTTASADARDRDYMPITKDPTHLVIGRPQIRIGHIAVSATGITATTSDLTLSANSIGAIQGASMAIAPTFKEHTAGYPEVKDLTILERASIEIEAQVEEFKTADGDVVTGTADTLFDMLLDTTINNQDYYCAAHVIWELADGGTLEFWLPNCKIESSAEITTQQDWSAFPVKLVALKQTHLGSDAPDLIYLLA